jgi:hypothetical protein
MRSPGELEQGSDDRDLRVVEAECHDDVADRTGDSLLCEVEFSSTSDPTGRLYFDILAVTRRGNHWKLISGKR